MSIVTYYAVECNGPVTTTFKDAMGTPRCENLTGIQPSHGDASERAKQLGWQQRVRGRNVLHYCPTCRQADWPDWETD